MDITPPLTGYPRRGSHPPARANPAERLHLPRSAERPDTDAILQPQLHRDMLFWLFHHSRWLWTSAFCLPPVASTGAKLVGGGRAGGNVGTPQDLDLAAHSHYRPAPNTVTAGKSQGAATGGRAGPFDTYWGGYRGVRQMLTAQPGLTQIAQHSRCSHRLLFLPLVSCNLLLRLILHTFCGFTWGFFLFFFFFSFILCIPPHHFQKESRTGCNLLESFTLCLAKLYLQHVVLVWRNQETLPLLLTVCSAV